MRISNLILILLVSVGINAATFSINNSLTPSEIVIGEQAVLHFEVFQHKDEKVSMPFFSDTIISKVYVVDKPVIDTLELNGDRIQINIDYTVTSFDSGFYYIPSQRFETVDDIAESRPMTINVLTVEVDEASDDINDIKNVMDAPFVWSEFLKWVGIVVAVLLIIALVWFVIYKYIKNKQFTIVDKKPEPQVPAHIVALARLEEIKAEKLWQSGKIKEFYTEVTDVLREYIEKRFDINAMELTSDEILALVKKNHDMDEVRNSLKQILEISDLVKFAKFIPLEDENSRAIVDAFMFVEKTVPIEKTEEETEKGKEETK